MRLGRLPRLTCRYRKVNAAAGAMGTNAVTFVQARRGFTAAWAVSLAAALGACESRRNEISHPTPENLPPRGNPLIVSDSLPTGLSAESLSDWTEARHKFLRARTVLRLGKLGDEEGGDEDPEVFGLIWGRRTR